MLLQSCLSTEQSVCCRLAVERSVLSVTAVMFVDRTECLLPCGCRMECTECCCSHVCQQNSVHLCLLKGVCVGVCHDKKVHSCLLTTNVSVHVCQEGRVYVHVCQDSGVDVHVCVVC